MTTDEQTRERWAKEQAKTCVERARKQWGSGWALLSNEQKRGAIAVQIVRLVNVQETQYEHTLALFQRVIALAMPDEP